MKRNFNSKNDVPQYAVVKNGYKDEIEVIKLSDDLREEIYEEFKDDSYVDYEEVAEFADLNVSNASQVIFGDKIINKMK